VIKEEGKNLENDIDIIGNRRMGKENWNVIIHFQIFQFILIDI